MNLSAILWDYDGTLMDTRYKNLSVNKEIFLKIKPEYIKEEWPIAFTSIEQYQHAVHQSKDWRDMYMDHIGYTEGEALKASGMWKEYQLNNQTVVELFEGIPNIIKQFEAVPQGICSLNSADNIISMLKRHKIDHCFKSIVGFDTIAHDRPKPFPDAFLHCLSEMKVNGEGIVFYIGDHQEDMRFADNAEIALKKENKNVRVFSIAAVYGGANTNEWEIQPDYTAHSVEHIAQIIGANY